MTYRVFSLKKIASSPLGLELFHYIQEVVVDLRLVSKLQLHLVQIRQSIFHLLKTNSQQSTIIKMQQTVLLTLKTASVFESHFVATKTFESSAVNK